jgi:hypothetical protein
MVMLNMSLFIFPGMVMQSSMAVVLVVISNVSIPNFLCVVDVVMVHEAILSV